MCRCQCDITMSHRCMGKKRTFKRKQFTDEFTHQCVMNQTRVCSSDVCLCVLLNQTWVCLSDVQQSQSTDVRLWRRRVEAHFFGGKLGFFRAAPKVYGSSQARGQTGAVAAGLYHSSQQRQILNPLSKAKDRILVLMDASQIC